MQKKKEGGKKKKKKEERKKKMATPCLHRRTGLTCSLQRGFEKQRIKRHLTVAYGKSHLSFDETAEQFFIGGTQILLILHLHPSLSQQSHPLWIVDAQAANQNHVESWTEDKSFDWSYSSLHLNSRCWGNTPRKDKSPWWFYSPLPLNIWCIPWQCWMTTDRRQVFLMILQSTAPEYSMHRLHAMTMLNHWRQKTSHSNNSTIHCP